MSTDSQNKLELWGGVECTVNRVHDHYFEQLQRSGHHHRISDLDLFKELGISALRQPVLWERVAPNGISSADWQWSDRWLTRIRELGIRPIVGLLHHGSGPRDTNLLDEDFPKKFAEYAEAVARRYPWVSDYTPVNEPLTTARFSALYGHWYPHAHDDRSFLLALTNQCKAVAVAMRAIRTINPQARLIQTEDLGKTFSTPHLTYQAAFDNERRWLSFDLLLGVVTEQHPLWEFISNAGVPTDRLRWFADHPTSPDIIGFNYYLSSERFLDHEFWHYPSVVHGGNGRDRYVDLESVRVRAEGLAGAANLLSEAWQRFRLPMAITECHNGCTREEQLRWLSEVWNDCEMARRGGVDVRAVTVWSLLGAFDWDLLVTQKRDHYESGVFDLRAPRPRPTAIATLAKALAKQADPEHPLLQVPGWWARPGRFIHGMAIRDSGKRSRIQRLGAVRKGPCSPIRPILITGASGTLGKAFAQACIARGIVYRLTARSEFDIADLRSVNAAIAEFNPWAIVNAAGYVRVDDAETDVRTCMRENASGPICLAKACANSDTQLVTFSSDLVFDGISTEPYVESDQPKPLSIYGQSKLSAEQGVLESSPRSLVIRTSAFFSPWDEYNFLTIALRELAGGQSFRAACDAVVSPTYVPDLVEQTLDLLIDGEHGVWHVANEGESSWYQFARQAAELASIRTDGLQTCPMSELNLVAPRPRYSALRSERGWMMPSLESAIQRYLAAGPSLIPRSALEAA